MRGSAARQWLHLLAVVLLVLGIAGLMQAIGERHSVRWDLTPQKEFSLAEPTLKALRLLTDSIFVTLYTDKKEQPKATELMSLFRGASAAFRYEILDLDRYPGRAQADGVSRYGTAVIRYQGERIVTDASSEQGIAGALLRLARGRPTSVRFLEGHGERDVADVTSPVGYGELHQAMRAQDYVTGSLNLVRQGEVPGDTDLLVVAGPKSDLLEQETAAIERYLERGGHVALMIDPVPLPELQRLVGRHGIEASLDIVRDTSNRIMGSDPFTVPVPVFQPHAITASQRTPALFAVARSVDVGKKEGADVSIVAETYPDAWAMRDFERAGNPAVESREPQDRRGPVPVMAAASWKVGGDKEARLVVVGDSDFAANGFVNLLGNRDLLLNTITWAVSAEALIGAQSPTRIAALRPLSPLVLSGQQGRWIFLGLVVLQPSLVLAFGTVVALRRRWKG